MNSHTVKFFLSVILYKSMQIFSLQITTWCLKAVY